MTQDILIRHAANAEDYDIAKKLMIEYREVALADDYHIGGNSLNEELQNFPGPYAPPRGSLLLAWLDGKACGCLALRPIGEVRGEVMRMYVQEHARGRGIAEQLMQQLLEDANAMGYQELFLDSLHRFKPAHRLYEKLGFHYCEPYSPDITNAMKANMVFMRLDLNSDRGLNNRSQVG